VALKLLPPNVALSAHALARFRSEARAIARLQHPSIVAVYDVVESKGVYAYAMEWVDGKSLAEVIEALKDSHGATEPRRGAVAGGRARIS
jgi:serine/threonine protein kinase